MPRIIITWLCRISNSQQVVVPPWPHLSLSFPPSSKAFKMLEFPLVPILTLKVQHIISKQWPCPQKNCLMRPVSPDSSLALVFGIALPYPNPPQKPPLYTPLMRTTTLEQIHLKDKTRRGNIRRKVFFVLRHHSTSLDRFYIFI